ncbi:MAG: hypothetical protein HC913_13195 [Microscillaceae bacterium]|nr:hypothetical protein [Microscillaceae bacterium]
MVNETKELLSKLKELANQESEHHLQDDKTFAFSVGQIVHYLLNQSEAGNRTHALLEPFCKKRMRTNLNWLSQELLTLTSTLSNFIGLSMNLIS